MRKLPGHKIKFIDMPLSKRHSPINSSGSAIKCFTARSGQYPVTKWMSIIFLFLGCILPSSQAYPTVEIVYQPANVTFSESFESEPVSAFRDLILAGFTPEKYDNEKK